MSVPEMIFLGLLVVLVLGLAVAHGLASFDQRR